MFAMPLLMFLPLLSFFGNSSQCHTRRTVRCDAPRRATDPRATRQTDDTRMHQSSSSVDCHEKERSDEPVYKPLPEPQTGAHPPPAPSGPCLLICSCPDRLRA